MALVSWLHHQQLMYYPRRRQLALRWHAQVHMCSPGRISSLVWQSLAIMVYKAFVLSASCAVGSVLGYSQCELMASQVNGWLLQEINGSSQLLKMRRNPQIRTLIR